MKKTAIALAIAGLAAATVAQAAPQANTFYAGAKAGWASVHHDLNQFKGKPGQTVSRNSEAYGVFGGYQITDNLAVEAGYEYFGRAKTKTNGEQYFRHTAHGTTLALKGSYPVLADLDVYGRVGAALIRSDYKFTDDSEVKKYHNLKVSPVFAAGVEYAILPELALRAEYQWVSRVGNLGKAVEKADGVRGTEYSPDIGSVSLGLSYRFGQGAAPAPAPEVVNKTFNLNSDVTFAFAKADLKPQAQGVLDGIYGEIAQVNNANVKVAGYTDRIGSDAYNQKLSQKRAETVANYLVAKGVSQNAISATGYGKANPVTGNKCDAVKGRKALIACLADDRRVEIAVSGTK
ncbi:porin OmpA [uncultured Aggregatibacter sp.]|uniref:porin OmpA n=1 Tax=uncultured Aggregatibacter sp. TaxID=470564 RepID=UPI0028063667|nr:porin OmpA [uncultured Aggregatibacter sp.]